MRAALLAAFLLADATGCVGEGHARLGDVRLRAALFVRVTDGPGGPTIPARLMFFDPGPDGEPVRFGELDFLEGLRQADGSCWIAPGALGTWDGLVLPWGEATIPGDAPCGGDRALPAGRYRVWAWQGIEYQRWEGQVEIGRGLVSLAIPLERAFTPAGTLAADLHVHAFASPDSGVPALIRALTLASAGIRVVALSDHNVNGDLDVEIRMTGMDRHLASIASNELGSDWAHVGIYPVRRDRPPPPEEETASWSAQLILTWARAQPGTPIVQVNHPRYRVTALFDLAGWDGLAWPPPFPLAFDAVEVLSGDTVFNAPDDRRLDEGVRDFYTLIDHGALVTAVGNSDTHHLTGIRDGLTRTYVFVDDPTTERFDEAAFIDAVRARRAVATSGPWLDVEAVAPDGLATAGPGQTLCAPGGKVVVDITVAQARFSRADTLRVLTGTGTGSLAIRTIAVPPGTTWRTTVEVDLDGHDGWIGVDVGGDTPLPVELTGNVHVEAGRPGAVPFAIINPILVRCPPP